MNRCHKIELRPTSEQIDYFNRSCGCMRFVYNQLVDKIVNKKEKYNKKDFQKFCSTLRKNTPWMQNVASRATYEAADNFHKSMMNFFNSCSGKRKGRKFSIPTFKKKNSKDSFQYSHHLQFKISERVLKIQGLESKILMRERIRFSGKVKSVTFKRDGKKWFAIFNIEIPNDIVVHTNDAQKPKVGVDLGIKNFATLSNGETIENPRFINKSQKLLSKRQRQLSRKEIGSNRSLLAKKRVSEIHRRIKNQRDNFQHVVVNKLLNNYSSIVIEDLKMENMLKKYTWLYKSLHDASFSSFSDKLKYKCKDMGIELVIADQFFASSKTCSCCGHKKTSLKLSERTFKCEKCGNVLDRDHNAAINLLNYQQQPSPQIKGRSKTDRVGTVSPMMHIASEAVSFDAVNNTNLLSNYTTIKMEALNNATM